ncbi:MAG: HD domain-containing protein [Brevinematales bacterium]|nr:HD domain-containing protein [Brevinematales bacterium]
MPQRLGVAFLLLFMGLEAGWAHVSSLQIEGIFLGELPEGHFPLSWQPPTRIHWVGTSLREVWFRAKVKVSPSTFLYIPSIDHEITVYTNSQRMYSFGSPRDFLSSFVPLLIPLGSQESDEKDKEQEILWRIRSETGFLGLPRLPLLVGNTSEIFQALVRRDVVLWVMVAMILFSALASLAVFYWYSRQFVGWLFAFAVTIAVYLASRSLAKWWIFGLYPRFYGSLELWSLFFLPFFVWQMVRGMLSLSKRWHSVLAYGLFGFGLVAVLGSLVSFHFLVTLLYPFELFLLGFLPLLLGILAYHGRKNPWAREVFAGFFILGITAVLDILREQGLILSEHIFTAYGWVAVFVNFLVVETRRMRSMAKENQKMVKEIQSLNIEILSTQKEVILRLSEIAEARSRETGNHVRRVSEYAALIGRKCGLSLEEIDLLRLAVPMHDLGKLAVPDDILHKPSKLTEEEFAFMKKHTIFGYEMLCKSSRPIFKMASIIALEHHERIDGQGYPYGKKGEEIHLYARITTVADVFDSLSSNRCYKKAWPWDEVVAYLRKNSGTQFEHRLVEYLLSEEEEVHRIQHTYFDDFQGDTNGTVSS